MMSPEPGEFRYNDIGHDEKTAAAEVRDKVSTDLPAPPEPFHSVPAKRHPAKLLKALCDVEVDQGRHFIESHVMTLCISFSILLFHLIIF